MVVWRTILVPAPGGDVLLTYYLLSDSHVHIQQIICRARSERCPGGASAPACASCARVHARVCQRAEGRGRRTAARGETLAPTIVHTVFLLPQSAVCRTFVSSFQLLGCPVLTQRMRKCNFCALTSLLTLGQSRGQALGSHVRWAESRSFELAVKVAYWPRVELAARPFTGVCRLCRLRSVTYALPLRTLLVRLV